MATLGLGIIASIVLVNETAYTAVRTACPWAASPWLGGRSPASTRGTRWSRACWWSFTWFALNLIEARPGVRCRPSTDRKSRPGRRRETPPCSRSACFVLSAVLASLMGSLTAHYIGFVTPGLAGFFHSIELVTMVVVGGMASVFGSILGAALLTVLPQLLSTFEGWETVIFGLILMLTMIFLPKGVVPTLRLRFAKEEK